MLARMPRALFIDGTGLAFRSFHALPSAMATRAGQPTNAVFGFATTLRRLLRGERPTHMAVVFDLPGPTARHLADPAYKAHRGAMPPALAAQLPAIDALVRAHDVPVIAVPGVEADDVLATLTREAVARGLEVWIVSQDKDMAQLVGARVRWFDPGDEVLFDADRVRRRFGVPPARIVDWLALAGDAADGIPGVPGIGARGAAALLTEPLEQLLVDPPDTHYGRLLRAHADEARRCAALARLDDSVPLPVAWEDLAFPGPSLPKLNAIYRELEFFSLLSAEAVQTAGAGAVEYFVIDSLTMAAGALEHETRGVVALHVLFDLPDAQRGAWLGVAWSPRPGRAVYLPLFGPGGLGDAGLALLRGWLEGPSPKVLHGAKDAAVVLARWGVTLASVVGDTALASYLLDPTRHLPHRLEQVARDVLHRALQPLRGLLGKGQSFADLTVDRAGAWACHQADAVGACWRQLEGDLASAGRLGLLREVDLPLTAVLARMERVGIGADRAALRALGRRFSSERADVAAAIHAAAGRTFTIGSGKQLGAVLFDELGLPITQRTKTGYSTEASVLERLLDQHPIIALVLRWRALDKLVGTYTDVLDRAIGADARIHPSYQATVSSSGRILTTDPDLQRTPVHTEESAAIPGALVAGPGRVLVRADWEQLELRLLAHISADPLLVAAAREGADLHRRTAAALLRVPEAEVDRAGRDLGKSVNFATLYGQGASALAAQLGVPTAQANRFIDDFFDVYRGVAAWRERVVVDAYARGFVETLAGRRRFIPELTHRDRGDRSYGERVAINTPIQGSGADLCKQALLRASARLPAGAELVLQVHDELLVDCAPEQVPEVKAALIDAMTGAARLSVPLTVTVGVGRSWLEAGRTG
jgi:DNA polymerase-1